MSIENKLADVVSSANTLTAQVSGKMGQIDQKVKSAEARVDEAVKNAVSHMPLAPNILTDTKKFTKICGGVVNEPVDILPAHSAPWSGSINGSYKGTLTIVTPEKFEEFGVKLDGDLLKTCPHKHPNEPYGYGIGFNVAIFDVTFSSVNGKVSDQLNRLYVLNTGCQQYTGWGAGEFRTQASVFVNVLSQTGDVRFYPSNNMSPTIVAKDSDVGKGWLYKAASQQGLGGCHQPLFTGKTGTMKVAIALPYVGTGNHNGNYIWAGSVGGRYTHDDVLGA